MRAAIIEAKLSRLRADRDAIPWGERVGMVRDLFDGTSMAKSLTSAAAELAGMLASDPKWEVRKEVADHLHKLAESDFAGLAATLTADDNAFVKSAAERALERKRQGHQGAARRAKGLDRTERNLRELEIRHGTKLANLVRDMAHQLYEGLVGASVHEMRSVVTAMKGNIEQLERALETDALPVARRVTPRLARSVSFLERLLDDMRVYTRVPSRDRATERLDDLVREALEMVRAEFSATGRDASAVRVSVTIPTDVVVTVSRLPVILTLRNLLKNALEAFMTDAATFRPGTVDVTAESNQTGVVVTIADSGMGMSPDELEAVCQFIPGRSSKANLGTGFGLPIARRNILAHGGDLRIESRVDHGTIVTVWLPLNGRKEE